MTHVLLIEDDEQIAASLAQVLRQRGRLVSVAHRASEALALLVDTPPDVAVLDLGLPDLDGLDVLRMVRGFSDLPLIVATARDDEPTIVRALEGGADDYVVKPFSGRHLDARIHALLRRERADRDPVIQVGGLVIDPGAHEVTLDGVRIEMRPKEFALLRLLASRPGEVVSRRTIAQQVWDHPISSTDSTIDVHVSALRRRLGETSAEPRYLHVIRGVGVKLARPADP
ncbi:response regulator transcription factor [Nocardioides sp. GY 10113]|uniref:response regulator transcription factor n=1 Tax=Nocardioides sp. GY 10113 TaxID=2569761 RepID=UPI0010A7F44C|nr:response regulator transcription factor [Nocardioides sp. GY 10113]TIC88083.1 response regulator transcription factor [Nocardioides sp. GY 10113]